MELDLGRKLETSDVGGEINFVQLANVKKLLSKAYSEKKQDVEKNVSFRDEKVLEEKKIVQ